MEHCRTAWVWERLRVHGFHVVRACRYSYLGPRRRSLSTFSAPVKAAIDVPNIWMYPYAAGSEVLSIVENSPCLLHHCAPCSVTALKSVVSVRDLPVVNLGDLGFNFFLIKLSIFRPDQSINPLSLKPRKRRWLKQQPHLSKLASQSKPLFFVQSRLICNALFLQFSGFFHQIPLASQAVHASHCQHPSSKIILPSINFHSFTFGRSYSIFLP